MKKTNLALTVLGSVAAAVGSWRLYRLASIAAAYKAKVLASGVFVADRDPASILDTDLALDRFPILRLIKSNIDYQKKQVTSSIFGLIERTARFTPGLGCSLCYGSDPAPLTPETAPPPTAPTPIIEAYDPRLDEALDWAFSEPDPDRPRRTRAVIVLHEGRIVAERYAPGFNNDMPIHGWSMAKAVTNALVGIMVKEGLLSVDEPAPVPEWQNAGDPRRTITLNHLLQMSSGLHFKEDYGNPLQDVVYMLFVVPDAAAYAARKRLDAEPGTRWCYSSGTTNIICRIIRHILGDADYTHFPRRALFNRLGMSSAVLERDPSGTFIGSSFMHATARDWARFGQLYLQDGVWEGERILPEGWVKYSTTPSPQGSQSEYGAHWWLKVPKEFSSEPARPVPCDAFHAVGHEGQLLTVIPSRELVIVRLGLTRSPSVWQHDFFIERVLQALSTPSPPLPLKGRGNRA